MKKILVSGVGGDIGFGVGRILKQWDIFEEIFGIDVSEDHPASIIFDHVAKSPNANDSWYLDWLCSYINKHDINVVIPTTEAEIKVISEGFSEIQTTAKVLINDQRLVDYCLDKSKTLKFLSSKGITVPENGIVGQNHPTAFPIIVKPRSGRGSKGIQVVSEKKQLDSCDPGLVWQEYLFQQDQEFTCAVYVTSDLGVRSLQMRRHLVGGLTGKGIIVKNKYISTYLHDIAVAFNEPGCYNVQLRMTSIGPKVFEINPRLSSTLVFRDALGFSDFRWWLAELIGMEPTEYVDIPEGTKFYRGNAEYFISADGSSHF